MKKHLIAIALSLGLATPQTPSQAVLPFAGGIGGEAGWRRAYGHYAHHYGRHANRPTAESRQFFTDTAQFSGKYGQVLA
ncbi:MAG: hypothetical protein FWD88_03610, partial [Treponema sp.]|nr:hypothetical protein [Treponema sp.]